MITKRDENGKPTSIDIEVSEEVIKIRNALDKFIDESSDKIKNTIDDDIIGHYKASPKTINIVKNENIIDLDEIKNAINEIDEVINFYQKVVIVTQIVKDVMDAVDFVEKIRVYLELSKFDKKTIQKILKIAKINPKDIFAALLEKANEYVQKRSYEIVIEYTNFKSILVKRVKYITNNKNIKIFSSISRRNLLSDDWENNKPNHKYKFNINSKNLLT